MKVRRVQGRERQALQPWYQSWAAPFARKLDAGEHMELVHLHRTGQATIAELATRFCVSTRTVIRYLHEHPTVQERTEAGCRVEAEARNLGLRLLPAEIERLATAALLARRRP